MNIIPPVSRRLDVSLAPGFSRVCRDAASLEPFQRLCAGVKPLKRFMLLTTAFTRLKPGANERPRP